MLDLITTIWICIGASYLALFVVDAKVLSKRKARP